MTGVARATLAMSAEFAAKIFPARRLAEFAPEIALTSHAPLTEFDSPRAHRELAEAEILVTSWGCPAITQRVLDRSPHLRAIVHAGGTIKEHVTDAAWRRGLLVSSATVANSIPVAEYTLAMILLANKRVIDLSQRLTDTRTYSPADDAFPDIGNYGKLIGVVGASTIGRKVIELLAPFDLEIAVSDPYLGESDARQLGVRRVDLDELLATSDIISLHAPALRETYHLIDRRRVQTIKSGATLINTARGSLVDQRALTERLATGDIYAILDVTDPWIPVPGDPLYELPNVLLTPHIAGSLGTELERLAASAIDESKRIAAGRAPRFPVDDSDLARIA